MQATFWILLFGAATIAARDVFIAAVAISIASAAVATATAAAGTIATLAVVAQRRAPDKGDMGASPIIGKYGN